MHVGTALRIGYFLGLDRYSFHVRGDDAKDPQWQRKRLVWAACYISDRQISIRLGRAFWSRGPGPLTTLSKADFPMLAATSPGEEVYKPTDTKSITSILTSIGLRKHLSSDPRTDAPFLQCTRCIVLKPWQQHAKPSCWRLHQVHR